MGETHFMRYKALFEEAFFSETVQKQYEDCDVCSWNIHADGKCTWDTAAHVNPSRWSLPEVLDVHTTKVTATVTCYIVVTRKFEEYGIW